MKIYKCPYCSYKISELEVNLARYDFKCPNCKAHNLSEFVYGMKLDDMDESESEELDDFIDSIGDIV